MRTQRFSGDTLVHDRRAGGGVKCRAPWRRLLPLGALALSAALWAAETPVNDAQGAVAVARKAWDALYEKGHWHEEFSRKSVARFEPYTAVNKGGIWTVRGTIPPGYRGVALVTTVRQSNGAVQVEEKDIGPAGAR